MWRRSKLVATLSLALSILLPAQVVAAGSGLVSPSAPATATTTATTTATAVPLSYSPAATSPHIFRMGGADRYGTAVAIARKGWPSGASTVLLANGTNYPDALAATPLAAMKNAPILLTTTASVPKVTMNEIKALKPKNIILLGGTAAISSAQQTALKNAGYNVTRYGGANRYATAQLIGNAVEAAGGSKTAILVTGLNYPDALSMGTIAGMNKMPIIFSTATDLPAETKTFISKNKIETIVSVGYTASHGAIKKQTQDAVGAANVTYITGADRYATSLAVANAYKTSFADGVAVATGTNFPDALTGAVLAARMKYPVLLLNPVSGVSSGETAYVTSFSSPVIYIFGGVGVLPSAIVQGLYIPNPADVKMSSDSVAAGATNTVTWTKSLGATRYRIRVYKQNADGTWPPSTAPGIVLSGGATFIEVADVSRCTFSTPKGGAYRVRVYSGNAGGWTEPGAYSGAYYVTTSTLTDVQAAPTSIASGGSVRISWTKVTGATKYRIRLYRRNANGTWTNISVDNALYQDYGDVASATYRNLTSVGTWKAVVYYGKASGWHTPGTSTNFYVVWTTGIATLDAKILTIQGSLGYTGDVLRKSFDYVMTYPYIRTPDIPTGDYSAPYALSMIQNHGGNCYRFAALFCVLARAYGYDARVISGSVPRRGGGWAPHGWVEIVQNGKVYVCDPDLAKYYPERNWFMFPYSQQPTTYRK